MQSFYIIQEHLKLRLPECLLCVVFLQLPVSSGEHADLWVSLDESAVPGPSNFCSFVHYLVTQHPQEATGDSN